MNNLYLIPVHIHLCIVIEYLISVEECMSRYQGVPIQKVSVQITEFVRISEVALILWRIDNFYMF